MGLIESARTTPRFNKKVRISMPHMLPGIVMPGTRARSSPKKRQPKIIPNCFAIK